MTLLQPLALLLATAGCATAPAAVDGVQRNLGAIYSEDDRSATDLERSLHGFLSEAQTGEFSARYVDAAHRRSHDFFFNGLRGFALDGVSSPYAPSLQQSYSPDGESYLLTVAFLGRPDGAHAVRKIVEFEARPRPSGYRFFSPFERNTARLATTTLGDVTFHHSAPLDLDAAADFARFREWFTEVTGAASAPLEYYGFERLADLLGAHGFKYDATKCNFLAQDLGFLDDDGGRFVTGTGRPDYIFGYLPDHLEFRCPESEGLYWPFVNGMAAYCGGYALTGEDVDELKAQFRAELAKRPDIDFLAEFEKARKSSVNRHFSHYVMCAFLCEAVTNEHGFEAALQLSYAGADGERFFDLLEELLDIGRDNFHASILELIRTPGGSQRPWRA